MSNGRQGAAREAGWAWALTAFREKDGKEAQLLLPELNQTLLRQELSKALTSTAVVVGCWWSETELKNIDGSVVLSVAIPAFRPDTFRSSMRDVEHGNPNNSDGTE